jgi:hypothetical protein
MNMLIARMGRIPKWWTITAGAMLTLELVVLLLAGTARASFGFEKFEAALIADRHSSPATQAGSHPYEMTTMVMFNHQETGEGPVPDEEPKDVEVSLPAGFTGDPRATGTKCTEGELESKAGCPNASVVGTGIGYLNFDGHLLEGFGPIYNMIPASGSPAQLVFEVEGLGIFIHLTVRVRSESDYGLTADASNLPQKLPVLGARLTIWGDPSAQSHDAERGTCLFRPPATIETERQEIEEAEAKHEPRADVCGVERVNRAFLSLPSSCTGGLLTSTITADSWQQPGVWTTPVVLSSPAMPAIEGCGNLSFTPKLSVESEPVTGATESPSGLNVGVDIPQGESLAGLATADLKKAVVSLPTGLTVSPSAAGGLGACSEQQIGLRTLTPPSCPDSSKVGTVEAVAPALEAPLDGSVYVAQQNSNPFDALVALYLVAEGDGVLVKLAGEAHLDPTTGQITTTFDNLPQQPVSNIKLHFFGGPRGPLVTPATCGSYTTTSQMTPWSSEIPAEPSSSFTINSGCGPQSFNPSFTAGSVNGQAGAFSPFTLTLTRKDGEQRLASLRVQQPAGLLGVLKSVVQCPEPQASLGTCGSESLIGHTTVGAGPGPDPVWVGGSVYLTGPYGGAPFGLSIVTHAAAGPFDLGYVVVRARIQVDPHTGQITVSSEPFPTILQGIPLDIRTVNVTVDRPGFLFNPTNCSPLSVSGTVTSTSGASAAVSSPFEAANCGLLPFKPKFAVSTQAKTSKLEGALLHVEVASAPGQANIGKVAVSLPKRLPSRLATLNKACLAAVFEANPASCPAASQVGAATATTLLLAHPLAGPAYLVSHGGAAFPDLVIVLQGEGILVDLVGNTKIKKGITSSTFNAVPDVPVTKFDLTLPRGPHSVLTANGSPCASPLKMPTTITGQNGAVVTQTTKISVSGCPKKHKGRKSKSRKSAPRKG